MSNQIEVIIISEVGSKYLPELQATLALKEIEAKILWATTPESKDFHFKGGKSLSPIEMATSISHHRARQFALELDCAWAIILEDDAQLQEDFLNIYSLIEYIELRFKQEQKLAIHLYPEQFGILKKKSGEEFLRVLSLPDCAVGYVMNKSALVASNVIGDIENEVADWHPLIRKYTWLAPTSSLVKHPDLGDLNARSLTSSPRKSRKESRTLIEKIYDYRIWKIFLIRFVLRVSQSYGYNPISNEKLRTKVLNIY